MVGTAPTPRMTRTAYDPAVTSDPEVPALRLPDGVDILPYDRESLPGAVVHVADDIERPGLPMAFAELHRVLAVDAPVELHPAGVDQHLHDVLVGAGFTVETQEPRGPIRLVRRRSLPDTVGPDMRLLVCGLNPSLHAADMGVGFGRGGNRFWPAALAAGLVSVDRDARHALQEHGMGMTDLVKRATPRAAELEPQEYVDGLGRVDALCAWLRPAAVCMVGLSGWRAAVDRSATAGWQRRRLGGSPVYVMPSTSGLNAHARLPDLTEHLRAAAALATR